MREYRFIIFCVTPALILLIFLIFAVGWVFHSSFTDIALARRVARLPEFIGLQQKLCHLIIPIALPGVQTKPQKRFLKTKVFSMTRKWQMPVPDYSKKRNLSFSHIYSMARHAVNIEISSRLTCPLRRGTKELDWVYPHQEAGRPSGGRYVSEEPIWQEKRVHLHIAIRISRRKRKG